MAALCAGGKMNGFGHVKGLVAEIGEGEYLGKVKVRFPQLDGLVSDWLAVLQSLTLDAKTWGMPRKDTQVIVMPGESPMFEDAVVMGAIYSKADKPPLSDVKIIGMVASFAAPLVDHCVEQTGPDGNLVLCFHFIFNAWPQCWLKLQCPHPSFASLLFCLDGIRRQGWPGPAIRPFVFFAPDSVTAQVHNSPPYAVYKRLAFEVVLQILKRLANVFVVNVNGYGYWVFGHGFSPLQNELTNRYCF